MLVCMLIAVQAPDAGATQPYARKPSPLLTRWTNAVSTVAPLPAYPRPQLQRAQWLNLNGRWQYAAAQRGQGPPFGQALAQTILVPFPVQSPLSGIGREDLSGWYRRTFSVPRRWSGQHVLLNFGAVSWEAQVYVNHRFAGSHRGDYSAFTLDITRLLRRGGPNELIVGFYDPIGGAECVLVGSLVNGSTSRGAPRLEHGPEASPRVLGTQRAQRLLDGRRMMGEYGKGP